MSKELESLAKHRILLSENDMSCILHLLDEEKQRAGLDSTMSGIYKKLVVAYTKAVGGITKPAYVAVPEAEKKKPLSYEEKLGLLDGFDEAAFMAEIEEIQRKADLKEQQQK